MTNVRERQLEIDLQSAAAKTQLKMVAADSQEATKAKIDVAVAEAQLEVLKHAKEEFTDELEHARAEASKPLQSQADVAALKATISELQRAANKREKEIRDVKLQLELPPRVQVLERATVGEK